MTAVLLNACYFLTFVGMTALIVVAAFKMACRASERGEASGKARRDYLNAVNHNAACHTVYIGAAEAAHNAYHAGASEDEINRQYARDVRGARFWKDEKLEQAYQRESARRGCAPYLVAMVVIAGGIAGLTVLGGLVELPAMPDLGAAKYLVTAGVVAVVVAAWRVIARIERV